MSEKLDWIEEFSFLTLQREKSWELKDEEEAVHPLAQLIRKL